MLERTHPWRPLGWVSVWRGPLPPRLNGLVGAGRISATPVGPRPTVTSAFAPSDAAASALTERTSRATDFIDRTRTRGTSRGIDSIDLMTTPATSPRTDFIGRSSLPPDNGAL